MFLPVLLKEIKPDKSHNPNFHAHNLEQIRIIMHIQGLFNINYCPSPLHWYTYNLPGSPLKHLFLVLIYLFYPAFHYIFFLQKEAKQVCTP